MKPPKRSAIVAAVILSTGYSIGNAKPIGTAFFESRVRPILVEHCYECHSEQAGERKGGLLLDRESGWLEGGDTGKAIVPGQPGASLLIESISYADEDYQMPPKYQLEEKDIAVLKRWVLGGAPGPKDDMGETSFSQLGDQTVIFEKAADHWSFQPLKKPAPPEADNKVWNRNPVDRFIYAKLEEKGIEPSEVAPRHTLTRRLSYALTGLPPLEADQKKLSPAQQIEKLMAMPQFGEHFARLWLDVARYADTANTNSTAAGKPPHLYPYAFTYRDYVVDAFNSDKPYDQFVREQLAADLMAPGEEQPELAALGFIALSPHRSTNADFIDDAIDATTQGFLGLTVSCARCHDHKFEPVPTADYYSLYGVFGSLDKDPPAMVDRFPLIEGYSASQEQVADYQKQRDAIDKKIEAAGSKKKGNNSVAGELRETDLSELEMYHPGAPVRAMVIKEKKRPVEPAVFIRGDAGTRGEPVPRRFLKILDEQQSPFNKENSGRLDLADKIVDPTNPLTARVYVNRVWGFLMGDFIVDTPSDFGLQGSPPSHPELLDYLAVDFIENGWSTKHLIKTIVSSQAFLQRSHDRPEAAEIDPENALYWRANRKRLRIEELRDSLLAVSGDLDLTMRGRVGPLWGDDYTKRRSIYGYINRLNMDPTLRNFDYPSPMQTQGERTENIVPPQALFLMNSPLMIEQSQNLIQDLNFPEIPGREPRIHAIYQRVFQRDASPSEAERVSRFGDIEKNRDVNFWPLVAQSLLMSNEFLYVD